MLIDPTGWGNGNALPRLFVLIWEYVKGMLANLYTASRAELIVGSGVVVTFFKLFNFLSLQLVNTVHLT